VQNEPVEVTLKVISHKLTLIALFSAFASIRDQAMPQGAVQEVRRIGQD
jgi:hypothetical protein